MGRSHTVTWTGEGKDEGKLTNWKLSRMVISMVAIASFLEYYSRDEAERATRELDGRDLGGERVRVCGGPEVGFILFGDFLLNHNSFVGSPTRSLPLPRAPRLRPSSAFTRIFKSMFYGCLS